MVRTYSIESKNTRWKSHLESAIPLDGALPHTLCLAGVFLDNTDKGSNSRKVDIVEHFRLFVKISGHIDCTCGGEHARRTFFAVAAVASDRRGAEVAAASTGRRATNRDILDEVGGFHRGSTAIGLFRRG